MEKNHIVSFSSLLTEISCKRKKEKKKKRKRNERKFPCFFFFFQTKITKMTKIENFDDENNENNHCDSKFDTTIVPPSISVPNGQQTQTCVLQQTTTAISYHRNGHSRNPSSINGITIAQVMQPPLNKPDAIDLLLRLIRFRDSYNDGYENCAANDVKKQRQICGIREARLISKYIGIVSISRWNTLQCTYVHTICQHKLGPPFKQRF